MTYSKALAKEILDMWKDKTPFFNQSMTLGQLESILKLHDPRFPETALTQADIIIIQMALVIAGAKFAE